ncbi:hypothetical protein DH09_00425 (plasmid) [Bacillaceae bacterium JMAK1]|nr:hypothetical protein DH09_00425 [Bacillaceae bacterium JMAK1]
MSQIVSYVLLFLLIMGIVVSVPEFQAHGAKASQLNHITERAVQLTEQHGGFTPQVRNEINDWLDHYNLDAEIVEQPPSSIQYGEEFRIAISSYHAYKFPRVLGFQEDLFSLPMNASKTGISYVWTR